MSKFLSILVTLGVIFAVVFFYSKKMAPGGSAGSPAESISTTAIKADLLSIAQAERLYFAQNGRYGSFAELTSSGSLSLPRTGRDGYTYSVEVTDAGFLVTARFTPSDGGSSAPRRPALVIDQSMQVHEAN